MDDSRWPYEKNIWSKPPLYVHLRYADATMLGSGDLAYSSWTWYLPYELSGYTKCSVVALYVQSSVLTAAPRLIKMRINEFGNYNTTTTNPQNCSPTWILPWPNSTTEEYAPASQDVYVANILFDRSYKQLTFSWYDQNDAPPTIAAPGAYYFDLMLKFFNC